MRTLLLSAIALITAIVAYAIYFKSDVIEAKVQDISQKTGLIVESVLIETNTDICPKAKNALKYEDVRGKAIYLISLSDIKKSIEEIDCVKHADVMRVLPNTLLVNIYNKEPLAIWQNNYRFKYVATDGLPMGISVLPENIEKFIIELGRDAPKHTPALLEILGTDSTLFSQISYAIWVGDRRWDLQFQNGTVVKLPEHNMELAWEKFIKLLGTEEPFKNWQYKSVDFRLENRVFAK